MTKKVIVLLADGFEDVEAVTPIDYLQRAGIEVTTVSISDLIEVTSRWGGIKLTANITLTINNIVKTDYDAVILPGGIPGAEKLAASKEVKELLQKMAAEKKLICAICASPALVLAPLGILKGKNFTCYPGMEEKVKDGIWSEARVVTDGNIITSRSAGTAGEFAVAIIAYLLGDEVSKKIAQTVLL
ncbi:MAG: DJ-1/PfpI family protein [Treponema sp.]|nr:DJ-1/PfpI family protein [Treponema sp.]MCL2250845.1 DJ-1/PfpI family protein [Treponema sp.]